MTAAGTLQRANAKWNNTANGRKTKMNSDELKSILRPAPALSLPGREKPINC